MASIICGNCHSTHVSVFDVKMCYADQANPVPAAELPKDTTVSHTFTVPTTMHPENVAEYEAALAEEAVEETLALPVKAAHAKVEGQGMFRHNGKVYKVQKAVHGSGNLYAKILLDGKFEYAKGMLPKLDESERMTLEEAKEYGKLTGSCCNCGRTLTDEDSIEAGIGPICAGKDYWG